jgi:predicted phage-related endonuclease
MSIERHEITDREQWLAMRRQDVTASDIGAVMGVDPYKTCAKVWATKTGLISEAPRSDFFEYRECQEGAVLRWLKRYKVPQWDIVEAQTYWRDPDIRLGCTPDAMAIDPARPGIGCIQIKTVRQDIFEDGWVRPDGKIELPFSYLLQTQTEAMLTGAAWAVIATEVMGYGTGFFFVEEVKLEPALEPRIKDVVVRFWADTVAGRVPKFDFDLDADVINALHPKPLVKEPALDLSADNRLPDLLPKRRQRKDYIKRAEKWVETADAMIKEKVGAHETAALPGWKISWKLQRREQRIQDAWEGRVLRVTEQKDKSQ